MIVYNMAWLVCSNSLPTFQRNLHLKRVWITPYMKSYTMTKSCVFYNTESNKKKQHYMFVEKAQLHFPSTSLIWKMFDNEF